MLKSIFPFKRFTKRISASKDNAKRFFGGEEDTSNVSSNPLNSNRNIDRVKRKSSVLESVATSQSGFGKATGFDVLNFFGNKKIARRLRKSVNRLKDALVQTFTVSKALRASVSNIFGQVKGLFGSTGGKLALGAALAGLAFFLFEKVIKPSLNVVVNWINSTGESIVNAINSIITLVEDISNTVNNVLKFLKLAPEDSEVKLDRLEAPKIELPEFLKTEEQKEKEKEEKERKEKEEKERKEKEAKVEANKEARTAKPSEFVDDIKSEKPGGFFSGIVKSLGNFFRGNNKKSNTTSETPMMGSSSPSPSKSTASPSTTGDATSQARQLIVEKEGFREMPYYDVNAYRAGYGSDTYTTESGEVKQVVKGQKVSREDADRDIDRRISTEFMPRAKAGVGEDVWSTLPPQAKAALVSITYNYGSLPNAVIKAAKSSGGNLEAIAKSVESLKTDDKGINANRRQYEANLIRNSRVQPESPVEQPSAVKLEPNKTQPKNLKTNPKSNNTSFINLAPSSTPTAPAPRPTQQISNSSGSSGSGPTIAFYSPSNPDPISFTGINYGAVG
tara:strand:- start:1014 stop:2696 length:1683 start_codon:yes stop_codon:yes gene_type:complete